MLRGNVFIGLICHSAQEEGWGVCVVGQPKTTQKFLLFMDPHSKFALSAKPVYVTNGPFVHREELELLLNDLRSKIDSLASDLQARDKASVFINGTPETKWVETAILSLTTKSDQLRQEMTELSFEFNEFKNDIIEAQLDAEGEEVEDEDATQEEVVPPAKEVKLDTEEISPAQIVDMLEDVF